MAARKKKYPRHCGKGCHTMHRTYAAAAAHKAEMGGSFVRGPSGRSRWRRKGAKIGFAAMSKKRRSSIARKGGRASAKARGY
jgi:hypothetical protein